jgi:glucose-1-phosphate thymidylyltransferase
MKSPITGVVLAGGRGTRLAPLTDETSKQLLPIGGKTLVERVLDQLTAAGVVDALLVIDERHACDFMRLLEDGAKAGLRSLAYVWQSAEGRGLPSAIRQVRHLVGTEKVIVACGDVLIEDGIRGPVEDFSRQDAGARIIAMSTPDTAGYSSLRIDGDVVRDIGDKDRGDHVSGYIDLGYYMYHIDVFEMIDGLHPSSRGETEIWDLNRAYVRRQQLKCSAVSGWWADVGESLEAYERAHGRYAET